MAKKQFFSIYLLRAKFDATNAIKKESLESIGEPVEAANLPDGGRMYVFENEPDAPWWVNYWGANVQLEQASKGAIVFLPVNKRVFAFTFGTGFHHLEPAAYVYDFGLRVTLNSVQPEGILSTDSLAPANAQRQRTQMPTPSGLAEFDFDGDRVVIKRMTGRVEKGITKPFSQATGAESLRIGLDVNADQLTKVCKQLLTLYNKKDYEEIFPTIDNLKPEKNPDVVAKLRDDLCKRLINRSPGIDITVPDIIDFEKVGGCRFSGVGSSGVYNDVTVSSYYDYLNAHSVVLDKKNVDQIMTHKLILVDGTDDDAGVLKQFPLFKCILCEIEKDGDIYHFSDGEWYRFKKGFVSNMRQELNKYFVKCTLPDYAHENEGEYNEDVVKKNGKYVCLDKKNIAPKGLTPVEPCDLYSVEKGHATFSHIKRHTRSAQLSHLFNQGANSIELIKLEPKSLKRMEENIESNIGANDKKLYVGAVSGNKLKVVYGIVTHKDMRAKSKNLPLFSCISLRNAIHKLRLAGVEIECMFIKDKTV